jgi:predicted RNA-binding Zn-ribbon protein involved in translation (DUF1610 family)
LAFKDYQLKEMMIMTSHHMIESEAAKHKCLYCGNELKENEWDSDHAMQKHYKVNKCSSCGRETKILVEFDGDGSDSWMSPVEKKVGDKWKIINILGQSKNTGEKSSEDKKLERIVDSK